MIRGAYVSRGLLIFLLAGLLLPVDDVNWKKDPTTLMRPSSSLPNDARIIVVPDQFQRIQNAVNNASEGDIVLVKPGTYQENVVVNKGLFLIGVDQSTTIIDGGGRSDVVTIKADNVTLSGFTIQNGSHPVPAHYGVKIYRAHHTVVQFNRIINSFVGIKLQEAHSNEVRWNNIKKNRYGIFLSHSHENLIYDNNVSENEWNGIELDWSNQNIIRGNTISNNAAFGFEIPCEHTPAKSNKIYNNNFINNTLGAYAGRCLNTWNDIYPVGGNFWDVYEGMDEFSGENQDEPGGDGIGDTRFIVDTYNHDLYPLMDKYSPKLPAAPLANFTFSANRLSVGETVTFTFSSAFEAEGIIGYLWDYGDGVSSRGVSTTHAYAFEGTYNVTLYVVSSKGLLGVKSRPVIIGARIESINPLTAIGALVAASLMAFTIYVVKIRRRKRMPHFRQELGTSMLNWLPR